MNEIKSRIEQFAKGMQKSHPIFVKAARGEINRAQIERYLKSIHFLVGHTPVHLKLAARRSSELREPALELWFRSKFGEEIGHDQWAADDLRRVSGNTAATQGEDVLPAMKELISEIEAAIERDPKLYLSYIFLAEYLTVLAGPPWLVLLERHCGIPRASMTVVGNHAELDKEHVASASRELGDLIEPDDVPRLLEALERFIERYDGFFAQVADC